MSTLSLGTKPLYRDFLRESTTFFDSFLQSSRMVVLERSATHREQTAHLQAALLQTTFGAGPDTNRSAGLHSRVVRTRCGLDKRFPEFTCCRSDLCEHLREHVYVKEPSVQSSYCPRRLQFDPPCRSQRDPGMGAGAVAA